MNTIVVLARDEQLSKPKQLEFWSLLPEKISMVFFLSIYEIMFQTKIRLKSLYIFWKYTCLWKNAYGYKF